MADTRVRILCTTMTAGMIELRRLGLKALDPRWCFSLYPSDVASLRGGTVVVDLTHIGPPNVRSVRLKEAAQQRGLRLATVHHLARLPPYQPGTG